MAAYASLLSLINLIHNIQTHPHPPITLHHHHAQTLSKNAAFLQEFLEVHSSDVITEVADGLESRIVEAAYAVQDVIDSHILDTIQGGYGATSTTSESKIGHTRTDIRSRFFCIPWFCDQSTHEQAIDTNHDQAIDTTHHFHQDVEKVIKDVDSVMTEAMEIKDKLWNQDPPLYGHLSNGTSERPLSVGLKNVMVGFDDVLHDVLVKLTGDQSSRQVISLVGMGGIGKTTLASNALENDFLVRHFDILSWATISQIYSVQQILLKVLLGLNKNENREQLKEEGLGDKLYKSLYGRRYLVVLDDIWSAELWDEINRFFPDNKNGSRILITTRLSSVASQLSNDKVEMSFLDNHKSWDLLCQTVFGEQFCPVELEDSARQIAKNCNGLPLSITIIGKLLSKFNRSERTWALVAEKLNSDVNSEYEKHCLQIIRTSYDQLPIHLKPCFLYMGLFPEDEDISTSILIRLWVAEGFVKPLPGKSLESTAEEYLMDLIDRNLILVKRLGSTGKIKVCNIHDLTRDFCLMEAEKEGFLCVMGKHRLGNQYVQRRIAICRSRFKYLMGRPHESPGELSSHVHSLFCHVKLLSPELPRMLRIFNVTGNREMRREPRFFRDLFPLVNLRFIAFNSIAGIASVLSSSICHWNLQILIITNIVEMPPEFWKLFHLRHVKVNGLFLSDPPVMDSSDSSEDHDIVLQYLQTLTTVDNFRVDQRVVKRIPNVRKLKMTYHSFGSDFSQFCLGNLGSMQRLESLSCDFHSRMSELSASDFPNITFPHSLVKLRLSGTWPFLCWEDVTTVIGLLPNLQVLKLDPCVQGSEWRLAEGKFRHLKYLVIVAPDLENWIAEGYDFPCLEHLSLEYLHILKEIPASVGDAPNLQSINLYCCCDSAVASCKTIVDEQAELGNTALKVRVCKLGFSGKYVVLRKRPGDDDDDDDEE